MNDLLDVIVEELLATSAAALEPGAAASSRMRLEGAAQGTAGLLLRTIARFTAQVPELIRELEESSETGGELVPTRVPHRARLSSRPADYDWTEGRFRPEVWLTETTVADPPSGPLRWLLHLADWLGEALTEADEQHARMTAQIAAARRGGLAWSRHDEPRLEARRRRLRAARLSLRRVARQVAASARLPLRALDALPRPYPRGRAWSRLRRLLPAIDSPWGSPRERARHLLSGHADLADLPFLYQRWCGLRLHRALEERGFRVSGDLVAVLFGAGMLRYRRDDVEIRLWVETMFKVGRSHPTGFACVEGREATPDLVLETPGRRGSELFVLDPTLATDEASLIKKGGFLDRLASVDLDLVAGVPTLRRAPLRSWACAPLRSPHNRILDAAGRSGRIGAIPLHPLAEDQAPLEAFVDDVVAQARAWTPR